MKFNWQLVAVLFDVSIYAGGVSHEEGPITVTELCGNSLRNGAQPQNTLLLVIFHPRWRSSLQSRCKAGWSAGRGQDLSQFARHGASRHIHLPEPVLRGDVALREEQILI